MPEPAEQQTNQHHDSPPSSSRVELSCGIGVNAIITLAAYLQDRAANTLGNWTPVRGLPVPTDEDP